MKKLILSLVLVTTVLIPSSAFAFILTTGDVLDISFASLAFESNQAVIDQGGATVNLGGDLLAAGESVQLDAYQNSFLDSPFFTSIFSTPTDQFGFSSVNAWQDLQGDFRLTMLAGSINIDNIIVRVNKNDVWYSTTLREFGPNGDPVVPEPSTMLLLTSGLMGTFLRRKKIA